MNDSKSLVCVVLIFSLFLTLAILWAKNHRVSSVAEKTIYCHNVCSGSIPDWRGMYKTQCFGKLILDDCMPIR